MDYKLLSIVVAILMPFVMFLLGLLFRGQRDLWASLSKHKDNEDKHIGEAMLKHVTSQVDKLEERYDRVMEHIFEKNGGR